MDSQYLAKRELCIILEIILLFCGMARHRCTQAQFKVTPCLLSLLLNLFVSYEKRPLFKLFYCSAFLLCSPPHSHAWSGSLHTTCAMICFKNPIGVNWKLLESIKYSIKHRVHCWMHIVWRRCLVSSSTCMGSKGHILCTEYGKVGVCPSDVWLWNPLTNTLSLVMLIPRGL